MNVHFIAVGGTGMGALASLLKFAGHDVRGSDGKLYPPMSTQLERAGIPVFEGFGDHNLEWDPDVVVVGNVCTKDHPEVVAARERGIPLESFPSMLARALLPERRSVVVAGTHGKTTTSSMVTWLLQAGGKDPSWLVGGVPQNLGSGAHLGDGDLIVLEGDEYDTAFFDKKSKFLHYRPKRAILTSVEFDHADIFDDLDQIRAAFGEFVELIPEDGTLVAHRPDPEVMAVAERCRGKVVTYQVATDEAHDGFDPGSLADYVAVMRGSSTGHRLRFEVLERGQSLGEFTTQMVGRYNVGNFLSAIAVAREEGVDADQLRRAVRRFRGVARRQELLGVAQGVRVMQDFAHHPTAVDLTVRAVRRCYPEGALRVCFEPRSNTTRRSVFFDAYAESFDAATAVYFAPLYAPHKVPEGQRLDVPGLATAVARRGVTSRHYEDMEAMREAVLGDAIPGDTVLLLSSGSFQGLGPSLLKGLGDYLTFGTEDDLGRIDELLRGYKLPAMQAAQEVESLVIRGADGVVGCVNLHLLDDEAHLFGLVVDPSRRGEGLGWILADGVLRRARVLGARRVYLITNDAADFFANRMGFRTVEYGEVSETVRASPNFVAGWSEAGTCMTYELPAE